MVAKIARAIADSFIVNQSRTLLIISVIPTVYVECTGLTRCMVSERGRTYQVIVVDSQTTAREFSETHLAPGEHTGGCPAERRHPGVGHGTLRVARTHPPVYVFAARRPQSVCGILGILGTLGSVRT